MISSQSIKFSNLTPPAAKVNNGAVTVSALDTQSFGQADIVVVLGDIDAALSTCKLTECDTSGGSYTDITSATLTVAATDDNNLFAWSVPITGARKRFIKPAITVASGTSGAYLNVLGILTKGEINPYNATTRGLAAVTQV